MSDMNGKVGDVNSILWEYCGTMTNDVWIEVGKIDVVR